MQRAAIALVAGSLLILPEPVMAAYREIAVANGGGISGRVRVTGETPKLPPQPVFKQKETCGVSVPDERLVVDSGGTLRNAVVALTNLEAGKAIPRDTAVAVDNENCRFVPHVLTATVGQMLNIHNSDPFLHDAHALLGSRTLFNVAV